MKDWRMYAHYVLRAIEKINDFLREDGINIIQDKKIDIAQNPKTYDAILYNLHTLAEAAGKLPADLREKHSDIPWRKIQGFRNILVHDYTGDVDPEAIAIVIANYLPVLRKVMIDMLEEEEEKR